MTLKETPFHYSRNRQG